MQTNQILAHCIKVRMYLFYKDLYKKYTNYRGKRLQLNQYTYTVLDLQWA